MSNMTFTVKDSVGHGYLALPEGGSGKGILVLHAWWGLNDYFKALCDSFAADGMVAFAPDLYYGKTARTVAEAHQLQDESDGALLQATAQAALEYFKGHPAVRGEQLSAIGFSMGAAYAMVLDEVFPDVFDKIVLFYGESYRDLASKARIQAHYGELDEWEPIEDVRLPKAAKLAWKRVSKFLRE